MRSFRGAIPGEGCFKFPRRRRLFPRRTAVLLCSRRIFLRRIAVFLRRNTALPWNSLLVSCRRVSFYSSAEPALDREGRYLNAAASWFHGTCLFFHGKAPNFYAEARFLRRTCVFLRRRGGIFLSVEKQKRFGYRAAEILLFNTYSQKTIGYLYDIQHGAKIIYETGDNNYPYGGKIEFHQAEKDEFLVYKTDNSFGKPLQTLWPRGYPLESIANSPQHCTFVRCKNIRALVQQSVINGEPDVDAIFRLTRKDLGLTLNA